MNPLTFLFIESDTHHFNQAVMLKRQDGFGITPILDLKTMLVLRAIQGLLGVRKERINKHAMPLTKSGLIDDQEGSVVWLACPEYCTSAESKPLYQEVQQLCL